VTMMSLHDWVELLSIGLTIPTLVITYLVLSTWGVSAWKAVSRRGMTSECWLIVGVSLIFLSKLLDDSFWQVAWTADFLKSEGSETLIHSGVYFNIPFRQILGIAAGLCHLRSYELTVPESSSWFKTIIYTSVIAGVLYSVILVSYL
jgi:hypothetical protein